jgi:hypothetical protein
LHVTLFFVTDTTSAVGFESVVVPETVQPEASVAFTVYVPGARPVAVAEVTPKPTHMYVTGAVPPDTTAVAEPVLKPEQAGATPLTVIPKGAGWVMVAVSFRTQPLESVIVTI